jgi:hypothetical protein
VAWIFAGERPRGTSKEKAKEWKLRWRGITRSFDIKAKLVRWLGLFIDCRFNWQAHVKHRLALGHYRIRTIAKVMSANGVLRKLVRKIAWEGQQWLLDELNRLSIAIGRAVTGTFTMAKGGGRHPLHSPGAGPPKGTPPGLSSSSPYGYAHRSGRSSLLEIYKHATLHLSDLSFSYYLCG